MKRAGNLYSLISEYENLCLAYKKAVRAKICKQEVQIFRKNFHANIQKIRNQLISKNFDIGHYYSFKVYDPKPRQIYAASFPERVLHHAIMNVCEPILDSYAIYDTYACRKKKGRQKAVIKAQSFIEKFSWYLKLDISKYFNSIDHKIVMSLLSRKIKDKNVLFLFQKIIDTYHTETGKGIPIGNLISQHLANFYLGSFDHWIKGKRKIKGYVRYMDDFLVFGNEKSYIKNELNEIKLFIKQNLKLKLKDNVQLNHTSHGIPFLGYRIFPKFTRLLPRSKKRFIIKFKKYEMNFANGNWTEKTLVRHMEPLIEFTKMANAAQFRRNVIERLGVLS
ncbi:MAG: group II intron reverse transcriptase domain-containing protein [Desulfobacterales bacterium]|nr:group II intron reverse transcriptase domain-containing protein [Desulfobacterales bacterium]